MPDSTRKRKTRERLHASNPACHFCGQATVLAPIVRHQPVPPNTCVLVNTHNRYDPLRGVTGEPCHVLACAGCAQARSDAAQASVPLPERQRRAGRYPSL